MLKEIVNYLTRFWNFVWHGETLSSWIVCFVLAFVLIQYLLYPGLGLLLGSKYPVVAVVSESMEHNSKFDDWFGGSCNGAPRSDAYKSLGFSKENFKQLLFKNGFDKGDLMILYSAKSVSSGDVIVFMTNERPDPIIHRVVSIFDDGKFYKTKGDNNCESIDFEKRIPKDRVIGKAVIRLPYLGWVKLAFVYLMQTFGYGRL